MSRRGWAILALFFVVLAWTLPPLVAKYVYREAPEIDAWTQNAARYVASTVALFLLAVLRGKGFGRDWKHRLQLIVPAIPNSIQQTLWVLALYAPNFYPGQTALLTKTVAVFGAIYAYLFFVEERSKIRSPLFLAGLTAALLGAAGVVATDVNVRDSGYLLGAFLTILSMAVWGFYGVSMKIASRDTDPITSFTFVSLYSSIGLVIAALFFGDLTALSKVSASMLFVLVFSGIFCMGVAHPIYFFAVKELGLAVCTAGLLLMAVTTPLLSVWIFGETFTISQSFFALILILGTAATIRGNGRAAPENRGNNLNGSRIRPEPSER